MDSHNYLKLKETTPFDRRKKYEEPLFVLCIVIYCFFLFQMFIAIPRIIELFESFGAELPTRSKIVFSLSGFLTNYWYLTAPVLLAPIVWIVRIYKSGYIPILLLAIIAFTLLFVVIIVWSTAYVTGIS